MSRRALAIAFATLLVLTQAIGVAARSAPPPPDQTGAASARMEKGLADKLAKGEVSTFVVEFAASADLAPAGKVKGWAAKGKAVVASLQATAVKSQKAAKAAAKAAGAEATTYWLTNVLVVAGDAKLAERMAALDGVTVVRAPKVYPLVKPVDTQVAILAASGDPEWGVAKIGAPTAWDGGVLGQGVVVANIDTGVEYTHPALVGSYRGNNGDGTFSHDYSWWDPTGICGAEPCDNVGHGTHTMGTIAGGDGPGPFTPDIGVAPGARWIAAKGCEDIFCSEEALLSSGQFILAPTDLTGANPDPSRRPDVVNNSWGGGPNDQFYRETVQAWRASGIIPVFSSGNPGPECGQGGSPGDFPEVISAGATDDRDEIAEFSGRGPSAVDGKAWNPDIAAPGVDVVSSVPGGGYESYSGTSMAAPHTTGEIALLLSARPALVGDFDGIANAVRATAIDRIDTTCGAAPGGDPNNVYGDGRIDAAAAVDLVKTGGTLAGAVTGSDGGVPIAGAVVTADNGTRTFNVTTAADGTFSLFLAAGDYGVTVRAFGYYGATLGPVMIVKDQTTTVAAILDPLPRFHVTGSVTASEDGGPIADATVAAIGTPVAPVTTAADGSYDLVLPIGDYTLRFSAGGCTETAMEEISSDGPDLVVDKGLYRKLDDFGHGCRPIAFDWVDATGQSALWGDEIAGRLRLPFPVPFYGTDYEQIWISDNGYLNFLGPDLWNGFPSGIPSTAAPNAAIYPLWQDLYLDEESQVDYAIVGDAPDRAFVLEFQGVRAWGAGGRLSFEVKLWENGEIDLLYGAGPANPGDGRNALVGIENATGTDALLLGLDEPILTPDSAYRIELVPSGLLHGTVTDANDGLPISGATVTAMPGGRTARTDADGAYTLRLRPGSYQVTAASPPYVQETGPVTMVDGGDVTFDFVLTGGLAAVEPMAVTATVDYGQTATVVLDLSNGGSAPTAWEAKERDLGATMPDLPPAATVVHRTPGWFRQAMPAGLPRVQDTTGDAPVIPIINDPVGDAEGAVDVVTVSAGSDGSSVVSMKLEFSGGTPMGSLAGYVFLDTDQDPSTGEPAEWWSGKPSQDVGIEFVVDLFGLGSSQPSVYLVDLSTYEVVAEAPAVVDGQAVSFDLPLEAMRGDDGFINTAMVLGDQSGPTDWAPDAGHGTITPFVDLPWLDESPSAGSVPAGGSQEITLTLGGPTLAPGEYHGLLVLLTDAPTQRQLTVPVDLTVTLPEDFGAVTGMVADAHSGEPLAGAAVSVAATWNGDTLTLEAITDGDGAFRIVGPAGTWPALVTLDGYVDGSADLTIVAGKTSGPVEIGLHRLQAHAALDRDSLVFVLTPGRMGTSTITISNPEGHEPLTFTVNEVALDGGVAGVTARRAPTIANPSARTSAGTWTGAALAIPKAIQAEGDVLTSWPTGIEIPWGVGVPGNVVISDPMAGTDVTFTTDGEQIGSFDLPWVGDWGADMAWDAGRGLLWQVNVGGDNGIYGLDPADGSVEAVITGDPWGGVSQRGLAYDPAADVFYTGGWNEGIIYRVAGPSHGTPGETLGQCSPADPNISGLAWNPAFGLLWMSTNSETDTIYLVDSVSCETLRSLPHPDGGGGGGAGIEIDVVGNLWLTGQSSGNAYLVESGLPVFSDVPWLTESPTEGTVEPDGSATVDVTADATGLEPGIYRSIMVVGTNDPANSYIQVPVTLVVPAYQQGVNAGGPAYVDDAGTAFAPDRAFSTGAFGYVGASSTRSTRSAIDGTDDDPLYQDLRLGMTSYRFTVAEGTYRVDLAFAEIVAKKVGARVFSITIEGETVVANLDVLAQAGGRYTALDRSFLVAVTDGTLDIGFTAQRGDAPIVNAILVTEVPEGSPDW